MAEILVLGGTAWLGREIATVALGRGYEVTCMARGESGAVAPGATLVKADRSLPGANHALADRDWHAVVEVSWQPRHVREALQALAPRARHWTYVSSISAYESRGVVGQDESSPLHPPMEGDGVAEGADYAQAKVACEDASRELAGDRLLIARLGVITGPGDPTDRVGYWAARFALAGDGPVLVPDYRDAVTQNVDVRDAAEWVVESALAGLTGPFNVVGHEVTFGDLIDMSRVAAHHLGEVVYVDPEWLTEQGVRHWSGPRSLPWWLPAGDEYLGWGRRSDVAFNATGGRRRPLESTIADTLADERARGLDRPREAGLTRAEELELIEAWKARKGVIA